MCGREEKWDKSRGREMEGKVGGGRERKEVEVEGEEEGKRRGRKKEGRDGERGMGREEKDGKGRERMKKVWKE